MVPDMKPTADLVTSTAKPWFGWLLACVVPPVLYGLSVLGCRWLAPWLLAVSLICQTGTSIWLARCVARKRGHGLWFVILMCLLLLAASVVLGAALSFAGCQAAESLHLLPPFRIG